MNWRATDIYSLVTTGLDSVVRAEVRLCLDCPIKSGNDDNEG